MSIFIASVALLVGIVALIWGADKFVIGSAGAARNLGISPIVIGLTIVSIGTSAPEIIVSINAALNDAGELAVGNALGSNIANIGLVLGATALVSPLPVSRHILREESPVLLLVTGLAGLCLYDGFLNRLESLLLALLVVPLTILVINYKNTAHALSSEEDETIPRIESLTAAKWFFIGLIFLLLGAEVTVWGAREIAKFFGISELVIGLTVIALGTSLPELAASVMSALKGHHDIAVGNVFGSNLFNLMLVMSAAGAISPMQLEHSVFYRDYMSMAALTLCLVLFVFLAERNNTDIKSKGFISRPFGAIFLLGYISYYVILAVSLNTLPDPV